MRSPSTPDPAYRGARVGLECKWTRQSYREIKENRGRVLFTITARTIDNVTQMYRLYRTGDPTGYLAKQKSKQIVARATFSTT